jgi:hypothetical protein
LTGTPIRPVTITTSRFADQGAPAGTIACVIEDYGDGAIEVQVVPSDGTPGGAWFAAKQEDIELAERTDR